MGLEWLLLLATIQLLLGKETRGHYEMVSKSKSKVVIFGAHVIILFITKIKILVLINWSYMSLRLSLGGLSYFEHANRFVSRHMVFICLP